jgi:hypothetical protein
MLRIFQASFVLLVCLVSVRAAAEEPADEPTSEEPTEAPPSKPPPQTPTAQPPEPPAAAEAKPAPLPGPWHVDVNGYFRAPMALGISSRPGPDNLTGPSSTQISYGPNRTFDANYYSFAYTRLQEQDWAEVFVHARKEHVDAAVGWMGYWLQAVGFRNYDAAWAPGLAYVSLDTNFGDFDLKPHIAFTVGAWWPSFGYFEKYDTYTLGRFRQLGEQLKLTVPLNSDVTLTAVEGFGTGRDGSFNTGAPPFYGAVTGIDLLTYAHVKLSYAKLADVGVHFNTEWTADPNLFQQTMPGPKSYAEAQAAHLSVLGAELNLRPPHAGHLWISPSFISVRNGWALNSAGTEVMHSLTGTGVATNYFAWTNSPSDSTGSGSMINLGFLYELTLPDVQGRVPALTLSIFGLLADASLDLPVGTTLTQNSIKQFKIGGDATLQSWTWLAFMLRGDFIDYDLDHNGYGLAALTARAIVSSHFLSSERIYIQFTRYKYGQNIVLAGTWPMSAGGGPLVAGSTITQQGPYAGMTPDENVIKLQADIAF